jgi:hypothetical protein
MDDLFEEYVIQWARDTEFPLEKLTQADREVLKRSDGFALFLFKQEVINLLRLAIIDPFVALNTRCTNYKIRRSLKKFQRCLNIPELKERSDDEMLIIMQRFINMAEISGFSMEGIQEFSDTLSKILKDMQENSDV